MISVGVVYFPCRMLKSALPSGKGMTPEPEMGLTMLEIHRGPPESAITPIEIAFRNPAQAEVRITTKEQKRLTGTIGFVVVLGRIEAQGLSIAHLARITAHLARNIVPRALRTAHPALRTAHPVHPPAPRVHPPAPRAHTTMPRAHTTMRPAHPPAPRVQHILHRALHPALHPVLRQAPLQARADLLRVPLRVPVVPVHFHQGVKATFSYEISFNDTDLLSWANIILCYRA